MTDRTVRWCVRGAVVLPFLVALVALARRHWVPVLDLAMTEFRVRDVGGRHTPLIGLPGRIGRFPDQGSHPGPLSFYLLAPVYRLLGSTSFALLVGTAVLNVTAALTALWIAGRQGGRQLVVGVAALLSVALAWFGASVLTQPWNPYLPLVSFVVVLLCAWAVVEGDHRMLIPQVVAGTLCAQTHVPYLTLSVVLIGLALGAVVWRWIRLKAVPAGEGRSVALAVGAAVVLWLPVLVDEVRRTPGNITMLRRHFLDPPESPQGLGVGVRTVLRHFDPVHLVVRLADRSSYALTTLRDLEGGSWRLGAAALAVWFVCAGLAVRRRHHALMGIHLVVAVAVGTAMLSVARVFGKVWYYLSLWAWVVALLAALATVWTLAAEWEARRRPLPLERIGLAVVGLATVAFVVDAVRVEPPEYRLSRSLDAVVAPTVSAIRAGVGPADGGGEGTYAVVWNDAYYFGSQGYGLISELERAGLRARAYETYRVPVTPQRISNPSEVTAEVVLATGSWIEQWRERPEAVEVAWFEPRSAAEVAEFDRLYAQAEARFRSEGLDELAEMMGENLFGASVDPRTPADLVQVLGRLLYLGQPTAVFLAPAGTFG